MNINFEHIDFSIKSFYEILPYGNFLSEIIYELNLDYKEIDTIESYLLDNKIIKDYINESDGRYILTNKGQEIYEIYGGIEKYNIEQQLKRNKELQLVEKANEKLQNDAILSKWQVKIFWPVFMFGIFSFIFGLYNFITQIEDSRKTKELQIELKNTQKELSKLRTLILDQKAEYSSHPAKIPIDSLSKK